MDKKIIEDYYNLVKETCVNSSWEALYYGLIEEVGELSGIFKRHHRGDENRQLDLPKVREKMIKELGDICWYLFAINLYWGQEEIIEKLSSGSQIKNKINPPLFLLLENVVNMSKDSLFPTKYFFESMQCLNALIHKENIQLEEVLKINTQKLTSRKERNVLMGEGDDR